MCNNRGILSFVAIETTIISLSIGVIFVEYRLFGFLWFGKKVKVKKGKKCTPMGRRRGAHLPDIGRWARRWMNHWVCDAWPVRRQTYGYLPSRRASPPFGRYQIITVGLLFLHFLCFWISVFFWTLAFSYLDFWTTYMRERHHSALPQGTLLQSGSWSYRAIDWTVSVVGVLLLRACRLGIRCLTAFVTQNWVSTVINVSWRQYFCEILTTKCTKRIIYFFQYVL